MVAPIKEAIEHIEGAVEEIKNFFNKIQVRRQLEETLRVHALKEQVHRQLAEVQGRLLHAKSDHVLDGTKERLQLDINQRLEAHFAERKRRRLESELITIKKLSLSIPLYFYTRLLIETDREKIIQKKLVKVDVDEDFSVPLPMTPFIVKLATSFNVDLDLTLKVEGDFKALLEIRVDGLGLTFDLSTNADEPVVFSNGDWSHAIP